MHYFLLVIFHINSFITIIYYVIMESSEILTVVYLPTKTATSEHVVKLTHDQLTHVVNQYQVKCF